MVKITGGEKFVARLNVIAKEASKSATLSVGFLQGSTYPDGTSVPMVAAIQEYGAPARNIPPRPFFRHMIAQHKGEWPDAVRTLLVQNDYDAEKTLRQTGEGISGHLTQSIIDTNAPPLAPATVKRKGHSKPLIDTGAMIAAINFKVE